MWTGSAQGWKSAFLRFLYNLDLSRGCWGWSFWAQKIPKVTTIRSLEKRIIYYQVVCYSPFRAGLQGVYCHWGLLKARQCCNLVKRKPHATSVLLRRARKCLLLQAFQKPEKSGPTQDENMGSCPWSYLSGWHKTPERKRSCTAHNFCRNTRFWGVLQQRGFYLWNTRIILWFTVAGRATWKITPWPLGNLKECNEHAGQHYGQSARRYSTERDNVACLPVVL